jgi:hypothetical protein
MIFFLLSAIIKRRYRTALFNVASSSLVEAIRLSFRDQAHFNTNLSEQYTSSSKLQFPHISLA